MIDKYFIDELRDDMNMPFPQNVCPVFGQDSSCHDQRGEAPRKFGRLVKANT